MVADAAPRHVDGRIITLDPLGAIDRPADLPGRPRRGFDGRARL